jgi:hypothetical protein
MKTLRRISVILFAMILVENQVAYADFNVLSGTWCGIFMDQFKIELRFSDLNGGNYQGQIRMYDGSNQIQDDTLTAVLLKDDNISFFIQAKGTDFHGVVDFDHMKMEGEFTFPDGSTYPLIVDKNSDDDNFNETTTSQNGEKLDKKYTPSQLKEDISFLRENLFGSHPQPYLYTSKESFDGMYNSVINGTDHALSIAEFYTLIAPIVANVKCSHTGIRVSYNYNSTRRKMSNYLPIHVFVSGGKAWNIFMDRGRNLIETGAEIVSINDKPMSSIITKLLSFIPAEGYNSTAKFHELNKNFTTYFNMIDDSGNFQIEYVRPGSHQKSAVLISAINYDDMLKPDDKLGDEKSIQFSIHEDMNAALLKISTFGLRNIDRYLNVTDSIFKKIKRQNIHNLVLDLRGNSGGHPIFAAILYSYLSSSEFVYFKKNEGIADFDPLYRPMQSNENYFSGNCFVLIDGGCLSTTGHLISLLKYHNRAVFIGEEPGSWFCCNDNSKLVVLPNSSIEVNIPQSTFETAVEGYKKGDPFNVDYPLQISADDVISGKDTYMTFTKQLINKSKNTL